MVLKYLILDVLKYLPGTVAYFSISNTSKLSDFQIWLLAIFRSGYSKILEID